MTSIFPPASSSKSFGMLLRGLGRDALQAQRAALPWGLVAAALAALLLGATLYVAAVTGQPISVLLTDPNAMAHQPNYFGALEYSGIILMSGAGWVSLFSAMLCEGQRRRFLLLGGLLSLLLAADDLFMLHENSWRFHLNERIIFATYGVLLVLLVVSNLRQFFRTPFVLLGLSLVFLAASILFDVLQHVLGDAMGLFEEAPEIIGICLWAAYFTKCGRDAILAARSRPGFAAQA